MLFPLLHYIPAPCACGACTDLAHRKGETPASGTQFLPQHGVWYPETLECGECFVFRDLSSAETARSNGFLPSCFCMAPSSLVMTLFAHTLNLLILMDWPESFGFTFPAFALPAPDLNEIWSDLGSTFHAYEDPVEKPVLCFRKSVFGHNITFIATNAINFSNIYISLGLYAGFQQKRDHSAR